MTLYSTFQYALQSLPTAPTRFVLAYSGGLDSHVLLHLLAQFKDEFPEHEYLAVHVHHGLSQHADDWLVHCEHTAQCLAIPFVAERVTLNVANRESLEAHARTARYQAITQHITANSVLLLGQHVDDQLETFLLQLKRGAGVKGLSAMAAHMPFEPVLGALISRPLLAVTQDALNQYAKEQQLVWVEDESNQDQSYDRNFLRHHIIPELKQRWPSIAKTVHRTTALCAEQQSLVDEIAALDLANSVKRHNSLDIAVLRQLSQVRRNNLIRFWLAEQNLTMPSRHHLAKVWAEVINAVEDANPQLNWQGGQFRRYQGCLYNVRQFSDLQSCVVPIFSGLQTPNTLESKLVRLPDGIGELHIHGMDELSETDEVGKGSYQCIKPAKPKQAVSIRFRGQGKCRPVGRQGSRSIKKLYQEYHIAPWLRDRIPLIYYDDELVCAVGVWICEGFQVDFGSGSDIVWKIRLERFALSSSF